MSVRSHKASTHSLAHRAAHIDDEQRIDRGATRAMPAPVGPLRRRPVLLIADDEALVRRVLERLARKLGYEVLLCENGTEAIAVAADRRPDVALVDLRMPGADGLSVLRAVRTDVPQAAVIIMTAYAAVDSAVEAIKLGAREYMSKPLDFAALRTTLTDLTVELERLLVAEQEPSASSADAQSVTRIDADAHQPRGETSERPRHLLLVRRTDRPETPRSARSAAPLRVVKTQHAAQTASPAVRSGIRPARPRAERRRRPGVSRGRS